MTWSVRTASAYSTKCSRCCTTLRSSTCTTGTCTTWSCGTTSACSTVACFFDLDASERRRLRRVAMGRQNFKGYFEKLGEDKDQR